VVKSARAQDPIPRFACYLRDQGLLDDTLETRLLRRADAEVADAVAFAEAAPEPARESAFRDLYADRVAASLSTRSEW
jgi:TPP-dependent pyruvate/acetoin dehydrogenase alpha subunit